MAKAGYQIGILSTELLVTSFILECSVHYLSMPLKAIQTKVAKKPTKRDKLPQKGAMVRGKFMKIQSFGTVRPPLSLWSCVLNSSAETMGILVDFLT